VTTAHCHVATAPRHVTTAPRHVTDSSSSRDTLVGSSTRQRFPQRVHSRDRIVYLFMYHHPPPPIPPLSAPDGLLQRGKR